MKKYPFYNSEVLDVALASCGQKGQARNTSVCFLMLHAEEIF